jgi:hypothetical protein
MIESPARTIDTTHESHYAFDHGFPTADTMSQSYNDADLNRAIQSYKFFYPTVSGAAIVRGNEAIGMIPNKVFGILDCGPEQLVFTANSDTPYGPLMLDLGIGPLVVELAPGPLIVCSMDVNQRWVADMGLPGPDAGKGGKHLLLPPDYAGEAPSSGQGATEDDQGSIHIRRLRAGGTRSGSTSAAGRRTRRPWRGRKHPVLGSVGQDR